MKLLIENFKKFLNENSVSAKLANSVARLIVADRVDQAIEWTSSLESESKEGEDFLGDLVIELANMFTLDSDAKDDLGMVFLEIVMNGSEDEKKYLQDLYNKIFEKMAALAQLEKDHVDDEIAWWQTEEHKILNRLRKLQFEIGGISRDMGPKRPGDIKTYYETIN